MPDVCLSLKNIGKTFGSGWRKKEYREIFGDISLEVKKGETLGIMGKSGAGKTTLGKIMVGLEKPTRGTVLYKGKDIAHLDKGEFSRFRRGVQMIFQDPEGSFNPVKTIGRSMRDVLKLVKVPPARWEEVISSRLEEVGLNREILGRYPNQLSGGMNQRAALARVLLLEPELIVLDEPTSGLDWTVQAQVLHLLKRLQEKWDVSYVLISHHLEVVKFMSHEIGILEDGNFASGGSAARTPYKGALFEKSPWHGQPICERSFP